MQVLKAIIAYLVIGSIVILIAQPEVNFATAVRQLAIFPIAFVALCIHFFIVAYVWALFAALAAELVTLYKRGEGEHIAHPWDPNWPKQTKVAYFIALTPLPWAIWRMASELISKINW